MINFIEISYKEKERVYVLKNNVTIWNNEKHYFFYLTDKINVIT